MCRELDDLILWLRINEVELGTWVLQDQRRPRPGARPRAAARGGGGRATGWPARSGSTWPRTLKRLDVTSRSLIALIEPGSCFAGPLLELALACDRQYMLDGVLEDAADADAEAAGPARIVLSAGNFGAYPMANGLTPAGVPLLRRPRPAGQAGSRRPAADRGRRGAGARPGHLRPRRPRLGGRGPDRAGGARLAQPRRADRHGGQPALPGPGDHGNQDLRPPHRVAELDLHRPNAAGPDGALRRYGTGQRAGFDRKRA